MFSWSRLSSLQGSAESAKGGAEKNAEQNADKPTGYNMNRTLSIRSYKSSNSNNNNSSSGTTNLMGFSINSLRGFNQPELSKRLHKLIKTSNNVITAHETAGRERISIATQLSEWGEQTGDEAINDVSDKIGVLLSELGETEENYAHALDDARGSLKQIRNTEKSVQPSRDNKVRIADEIARLKVKEPENTKIVTLEQELVRAEAENLVGEAQLTNTSRQKLKEAYDAEFLAIIERAEKQIILARHGRRLIHLLDDSPIVPGEQPLPYTHGAQARQILNDAEDDMRDWNFDPNDLLVASEAAKSRTRDVSSPSSKSNKVRKTAPRPQSTATDGSDAAETPVPANPQGEHALVEEAESPTTNAVGVYGGGAGDSIRSNDTEASLLQSSQQLDGSTVLTGSPVSSTDGWRVHANLLSPKHSNLAY